MRVFNGRVIYLLKKSNVKNSCYFPLERERDAQKLQLRKDDFFFFKAEEEGKLKCKTNLTPQA